MSSTIYFKVLKVELSCLQPLQIHSFKHENKILPVTHLPEMGSEGSTGSGPVLPKLLMVHSFLPVIQILTQAASTQNCLSDPTH